MYTCINIYISLQKCVCVCGGGGGGGGGAFAPLPHSYATVTKVSYGVEAAKRDLAHNIKISRKEHQRAIKMYA